MIEQEFNEQQVIEDEFNALKKILGTILLEHDGGINHPADTAYYSRKFEEVRKRLMRK